jgi:hypothetical protein
MSSGRSAVSRLRRDGVSRLWRPALLPALLLLVGAAPLSAANALLLEGPDDGRGIPFLYPNVMDYAVGRYRLSEGSRVTVYYTREAVAVQEEWETVGCNGRSLRGFAFRGNSVRYVPGDEFSLFLVFPADAGAQAGEGEAAAAGARAPSRARLCSFIDQFIEDFTYFRGAVGDRDGAPFPAVLQFPGS